MNRDKLLKITQRMEEEFEEQLHEEHMIKELIEQGVLDINTYKQDLNFQRLNFLEKHFNKNKLDIGMEK
jgi:hypothetical protein